jgi:hypothetical protein
MSSSKEEAMLNRLPFLAAVAALTTAHGFTDATTKAQWAPSLSDFTVPLLTSRSGYDLPDMTPLQPRRAYRFGDAPLERFRSAIEASSQLPTTPEVSELQRLQK